MKENNHETVFFNRAKVDDAISISCDECFEQVIFALQDKKHHFSIGMTTILECLEFAEREGEIPMLPPEWWRAVNQRYRKLLE